MLTTVTSTALACRTAMGGAAASSWRHDFMAGAAAITAAAGTGATITVALGMAAVGMGVAGTAGVGTEAVVTGTEAVTTGNSLCAPT